MTPKPGMKTIKVLLLPNFVVHIALGKLTEMNWSGKVHICSGYELYVVCPEELGDIIMKQLYKDIYVVSSGLHVGICGFVFCFLFFFKSPRISWTFIRVK